MPATVSVLVTFEGGTTDASNGSLWLALADLCRSSGIEATFTLSGARASRYLADAGPISAVLRTQNVGLLAGADEPPIRYLGDQSWERGAAEFRARENDSFLAVSKLGAAIPTSLTMRGWAPQTLAVASDWGTRSYVVKTCPLENSSRPFFLGGRLHFSNLGADWVDVPSPAWASGAGLDPLAQFIERRASELGTAAGVIVARFFPDQLPDLSPKGCSAAAESFAKLLTRLRGVESVMLQSSRQVVDRFADISYDHAIPAEFFRSSAESIARGELAPIEYELGYLAPAEQLYGLAKIWSETLKKGKPVRNTVLRTPHGPPTLASTDEAVRGISAEELPGVLSEICRVAEDVGQLPASVALKSGPLSVADLLATLAGGFQGGLEVVDLPLRRGRLDEKGLSRTALSRTIDDAGLGQEWDATGLFELTRSQVWTYKPVQGL